MKKKKPQNVERSAGESERPSWPSFFYSINNNFLLFLFSFIFFFFFLKKVMSEEKKLCVQIGGCSLMKESKSLLCFCSCLFIWGGR